MGKELQNLLELTHQLDRLEPLYSNVRQWVSQHIPGDELVFYQPNPLEDLAYDRVERVVTYVLRGDVSPSEHHPVDDLRSNQSGLIDLGNELVHLELEGRWFGSIECSTRLDDPLLENLDSLTRIVSLGVQFRFHRDRSEFSEWLLNLHRSLIGPETFDDLLDHMFDGLEEEIGTPQIGFYSDQGGDFGLVRSRGFSSEQYQNRRVLVREELLQEGLGEKPFIPVETEEGGGLLVPLETGKKMVGLLGFFDPSWDDQPSNHLLSRLDAVKTVTALVIHAFQLQQAPERSVIQDQLTGLKTPDYFRQRLREEIARVKRYGNPCGLLVLDVDEFASVNETFGFPAGDYTLRELGRLIRNNVRSVDLACRFENDQFAIMFPNTSIEGCLVASERLQKLAREPFLKFQGKPIGIRFSGGLASYPGDGKTEDELFKQAKLALYEAKQTGKDQVVTARNLKE